MATSTGKRARVAALILACVGAVIAAYPAPADAQGAYGAYAEGPADALARNMKLLASNPKDFNALIGAGKAAIALGDSQAAAGFFGRAEEVWPSSPLPKVGMGAALAHEGDTAGALQYFARAEQMGAARVLIGAERGLAYDLMGHHAHAQADYRAAMAGPDHEEARRRLALSLAITGNKEEALGLLAPLMAKRDAGAARCRALILALTGDASGARAAIEAAMPGSSHQMDYFFRRLPTLSSSQKAAAVHLGIFPNSTGQIASSPATPLAGSPGGANRLASIDQFLAPPPAAAAPPPAPQPKVEAARRAIVQPAVPVRTASRSAAASTPARLESKLWLQLAAGDEAEVLSQEFRRMKARSPQLLSDIDGYIAEAPDGKRLLIGPFRNSKEAGIFADDLASSRIHASRWTSPAGQSVRKISAE